MPLVSVGGEWVQRGREEDVLAVGVLQHQAGAQVEGVAAVNSFSLLCGGWSVGQVLKYRLEG